MRRRRGGRRLRRQLETAGAGDVPGGAGRPARVRARRRRRDDRLLAREPVVLGGAEHGEVDERLGERAAQRRSFADTHWRARSRPRRPRAPGRPRRSSRSRGRPPRSRPAGRRSSRAASRGPRPRGPDGPASTAVAGRIVWSSRPAGATRAPPTAPPFSCRRAKVTSRLRLELTPRDGANTVSSGGSCGTIDPSTSRCGVALSSAVTKPR